MSASSNILGENDPSNAITFKFKPYLTSPDGHGNFFIDFPAWYDLSKLNMMYDEQAMNKCTSDDMEITSSLPNLFSLGLAIEY